VSDLTLALDNRTMPIPKSVAAFNRRVTNYVTGPFAGRLPGFAIVRHVGRKSGRVYRTPVNVFHQGDDYVFALTYGPDSDWVRNVEAAGQCEIETRGRVVRLAEPRRMTDPTRQRVPAPVRTVLRLIEVDEFLVMHPVAS
jgi:deazaflavin-dependent oxidoreductase (nitroreductase family)